jgi:hypothetical protein
VGRTGKPAARTEPAATRAKLPWRIVVTMRRSSNPGTTANVDTVK